MTLDFSVELGPDDPTLAIPWPGYVDLRAHRDRIPSLDEARRWPELSDFLTAINSPRSLLQSAKCDAWFTRELTPEDEIFGASAKLGGYIDLFFHDPGTRLTFPYHQEFGKRLAGLLHRAPEMPSSAEILLRRAHYELGAAELQSGFYFTLYVFGFGDEESQCRERWAIALKLMQNAFIQLSA